MKTVTDIDNWFDTECREAFVQVPLMIRNIAKTNTDGQRTIAESIARKKCFSEIAVLSWLREELRKPDKQVTTVTTTADLDSEAERAAHLDNFPERYKADRILLRGSFGEMYYEHTGADWVRSN